MEYQIEFTEFPKMARLSREVIITEKIDGTNAQLLITESGDIFSGSRTKFITPSDDNHGFAKWVEGNKNELLTLGPGRHFGEWWGSGIQRGYGLKKGEKRFSLFNVIRWAAAGTEPKIISSNLGVDKLQSILPQCCSLVPELYRGNFDTQIINDILEDLRLTGSRAVKGFLRPEGVVVFHTAANIGFKKTIEKDELPKSMYK